MPNREFNPMSGRPPIVSIAMETARRCRVLHARRVLHPLTMSIRRNLGEVSPREYISLERSHIVVARERPQRRQRRKDHRPLAGLLLRKRIGGPYPQAVFELALVVRRLLILRHVRQEEARAVAT